jgi:hypothetical protein
MSFTVLLRVYIARIFFKHDIYVYFISGRDLDRKILLLCYKYNNIISFYLLRNLNSDYGCLVQPERVAFSVTLVKCCVWKVCVNFGHPLVMLILNKKKVKCHVFDIILGERNSIKFDQ